ncbi:hypothetical protein D3C85_1601270 [compost metagenome]
MAYGAVENGACITVIAAVCHVIANRSRAGQIQTQLQMRVNARLHPGEFDNCCVVVGAWLSKVDVVVRLLVRRL